MARQMKDSGIEWIGEIPAAWTICRLKDVYTLSIAGEVIDKNYWHSGSELLYTCQRTPMMSDYPDFPARKRTTSNDLLLTRNATPYIFIPENGAIYSNVVQKITIDNTVDRRFVRYVIKEGADALIVNGNTIPSYNMDIWSSIHMTLPPLDEQQHIVYFLDRQCAEIDAVIERTKATIEEYKKLKQAVITEAVTKGVRSPRPMKDSGIEWIGEIPEGWSVPKFGYVAEVKSNLVAPELYPNHVQISPENIEKGSGRLLSYGTVADAGVISGNHLFHEGQILYSKIRPKLNKVCIAPCEGLCSADMYPIETHHVTRFVMYCMLSDVFLSQVAMVTEERVKMPKINQEELARIRVAMPGTTDEESEIVEYLDMRCSALDTLIAKKTALLTELETYKKSLIYEYVTGKKEVL